MLPVDGNQSLIGLLGVADDLGDAVLVPQTLDLLVTLQTKMERIPTPAQTNSLLIQSVHTLYIHSLE